MDLDWEYPALDMWPVVPTNPEDKQHFTLLMKEIRHAFDIEGFLLTFAAAPDPAKANNAYELEEVAQNVDLTCMKHCNTILTTVYLQRKFLWDYTLSQRA